MKKLCVISLLVSMLVLALAPGTSALDRDWRKVELEKYVQADGDEYGWGVESTPDGPAIQPWFDRVIRGLFSVLNTDRATINEPRTATPPVMKDDRHEETF